MTAAPSSRSAHSGGTRNSGIASDAVQLRIHMNEVLAASDRLAAATTMGAVTLLVGDLDAQTAFYRDVLTLTVQDAAGDTVTLGRAGPQG